jgi:hypothetical protein
MAKPLFLKPYLFSLHLVILLLVVVVVWCQEEHPSEKAACKEVPGHYIPDVCMVKISFYSW